MQKKVFKKSGYIYVKEHTTELPAFEEFSEWASWLKNMRSAANKLGYLKGGYKFADNITSNEDQDDMGEMKVVMITEEKAENSFALFNANGETISKVLATASSKTGGTGDDEMTITSIGGITNLDDKSYDILFVSPDNEYGDTCIVTIGKNISGLEINPQPNQVTPLNCTYTALPMDDTGALCRYIDLKTKFKWTWKEGQATVTYKLTESQPDDWATNYNDYYTLSDGVYVKNNESSAPTWAAGTYYSVSA